MSRKTHLLAAALLGAAVAVVATATPNDPTAGTAPPPTTAQAAQPSPAVAPEPQEAPIYGPITARDPAVRVRIKHLYQEQRALADETATRIAELTAKIAAESDPDFRWELQREVGTAKKDLEIRHVQLGLEIAQLNGDEQRAAEFEAALDRMLHPEKYLSVDLQDRDRNRDRDRDRDRDHQ